MSPSAPHAAGSVHTVSQVLYMYTAQVQRGYPHCTGTLSGVYWSGQTMRRGRKSYHTDRPFSDKLNKFQEILANSTNIKNVLKKSANFRQNSIIIMQRRRRRKFAENMRVEIVVIVVREEFTISKKSITAENAEFRTRGMLGLVYQFC
jgi:hypothetical protein